MPPSPREVLDQQDGVEDVDEQRYISVWKLFQSPVWDAIWSRGLVFLETPQGYLNLGGFGEDWFAAWDMWKCPQLFFDHLYKYCDEGLFYLMEHHAGETLLVKVSGNTLLREGFRGG